MLLFKEETYESIQKEFEQIAKIYGFSTEVIEENYYIISISLVLVGVIFLITAIGIFMLKNWARILAIILFCFQMLYSAILFYYDPLALIYIAISILVIWYLLRADVTEIFKGDRMSIEERILGQKP